MMNTKEMEKVMGLLLLIGTLTSLAIVIVGGGWYLAQFGSDDMQFELLQTDNNTHTIHDIWRMAFTFTPLGIIQLGLLLLVATQTFRVGLLCFYYARVKDYTFTLISTFILLVLVYCTFWRN